MEISIFDLGIKGPEMLENWKNLKKNNEKITVKEFPKVNPYIKIDGLDEELMDFVLSIVIQTEQRKKQYHKALQAKGIAQAKENGVLIGRKPLDIPKAFTMLYPRIKNKEINITNAARQLKVDYKTVKKWVMLKDEKESINK